MKKLSIGFMACVMWIASANFAAADELQDRMAFWESKAFICTDGGQPFPSKEKLPDASDPSHCDDGDMTLFNGLLCAAGDVRGCNGVKEAQDTNGRWWRSPRVKGWEAPAHDVSFSPDMALGVLHYVAHTSDKVAFRLWLSWINTSRPCIAEFAGNCLFQGWPRFCTDDAQDKRCTFRPTNCEDLERTGDYLSVPEGALCRNVLKSFDIRADYVIPTTELVAASALVNDAGFSSHLAAVEVFLLERIGLTSVYTRAAAVTLALRDNKNPFFVFLAEGPTQNVKQLVLRECPTPQRPSLSRTQWSWERASSDKPWLNSMYWDCIFMGRLLGY
jgi:hypothetical protein